MIQTFAALLIAHILADFVLQTRWMVTHKRRAGVLLLHGALVLAAAQAVTGQPAAPGLLALAAAHLLIDAVKLRLTPGLGAFLGDQGAHLATLALAAALMPDLWASGYWPALLSNASDLLTALLWLAGLILATRAGGFAVGLLMAGLAAAHPPEGLPKGGQVIGILERGLIFVLMTAGQPEAIGFLIAAKSILRFGTVTTAADRAVSEYVIIGTLASFGWAILAALATLRLLAALAT